MQRKTNALTNSAAVQRQQIVNTAAPIAKVQNEQLKLHAAASMQAVRAKCFKDRYSGLTVAPKK
jgi:hypothetical protein